MLRFWAVEIKTGPQLKVVGSQPMKKKKTLQDVHDAGALSIAGSFAKKNPDHEPPGTLVDGHAVCDVIFEADQIVRYVSVKASKYQTYRHWKERSSTPKTTSKARGPPGTQPGWNAGTGTSKHDGGVTRRG
jgi:hypothetical protein